MVSCVTDLQTVLNQPACVGDSHDGFLFYRPTDSVGDRWCLPLGNGKISTACLIGIVLLFQVVVCFQDDFKKLKLIVTRSHQLKNQ